MNWLLTTCAEPVMSPLYTNEKRPPLGLGFLISVLRRAGHKVFFIDNYLKPSDFLESGFLQKNRIDVVGIYANTICFDDLISMTSRLTRLREKGAWTGRIVVGGPHPSVAPETIPEEVDHIVIGEGERAVLDLAEGAPDRIIRSPLISDLDSLPPPAWDDFLKLPYQWETEWMNNRPVFTMNTSRGCPFNCAFCSVKSIWGRTYRTFSVDWIMDHLDYLVRECGARGIYFREDNFTVNSRRVTEFCERLLAKGPDIEWMCETRVDLLDRELVGLMSRAGCRGYYFGVESGSQRLLDFMEKGVTVAQIEEAFSWCREAKIKTYASMVVGVPGETEDDLVASKRLCWKIRPDRMTNNIFVGIPNSQLYGHVLKNNLHSFIDSRGLVYMKGHDARVDQYYGGEERIKTPYPARRHFVLSRELLVSGYVVRGIAQAFTAVALEPGNKRYRRHFIKSFLPRPLLNSLTKVRDRLVIASGFNYDRRKGLIREAVRFALVRPKEQKKFLIVSAQRNAGEAAVKCLDSVYGQRYDRDLVRHVFIDDASTDGTAAMVEDWMDRHPDHNLEYIRNPERLGLCANNLRGFGMAGPATICIELNGDDWLPNKKVLAFLNKVYSNKDIWMTYNTLRYVRDGKYQELLYHRPFTRKVIRANSYRDLPWTSNALHSFRIELYRHLKEEDFIDPESGNYWNAAVDQAFYLPMLEMASLHCLHVYRVMYIYNFRDSSLGNLDPAGQQEKAGRIRLMPRYEPLKTLF
jgi:radical SAM superfamily enzyme YgiQ (UPF0313 family)